MAPTVIVRRHLSKPHFEARNNLLLPQNDSFISDTFWFSVVRHPFEHFSSAFNQMTRYLKEDKMRREFWIKQMKRFNINVR